MPPPPQAGGGSSTPRTAKNVNVRIPSGGSDLSVGSRDRYQRRQAERDSRLAEATAEARKEEAADLQELQARRLKKFQRDRDPEAFPETETEMSSVAPPPPPATPHPVGTRVVEVKDVRVDGVIESVINGGQFIYTVTLTPRMATALLPTSLAGSFLFGGNDDDEDYGEIVVGLSGLVHESIVLEVESDEEVSVAFNCFRNCCTSLTHSQMSS
jgi:hypothetical protein